jgi:DMSO/TMAO reductase YedYZ molybdopterin-dependent catalytic subunit
VNRLLKTNRRQWLQRAMSVAVTFAVSSCDRLAESESVNDTLEHSETLTEWAQRLLLGRRALAPEYSEQDISREFRANGTTNPGTDEYNRLAQQNFVHWRLGVGGLVERPLALSLDDLRALPARTQITRHDCVEGWSCIGKWKGVTLSGILDQAQLKARAKYVAFFCADSLEPATDGTGQYYETIDLVDARHPQTILAYDMNDRPLTVPHGAPLRLRLERQLGYKMAKYIVRIEVVETFAGLGRGKGGYWEDRGYQWYAGI